MFKLNLCFDIGAIMLISKITISLSWEFIDQIGLLQQLGAIKPYPNGSIPVNEAGGMDGWADALAVDAKEVVHTPILI